jgi:hypothetical protein
MTGSGAKPIHYLSLVGAPDVLSPLLNTAESGECRAGGGLGRVLGRGAAAQLGADHKRVVVR